MILLAGFIEVLCKALTLIGLAASVGGTAFVLAVLRPLTTMHPHFREAAGRSLYLIAVGGIMAALGQAMALVVEPWALADELGQWPVAAFLSTGFARAGMIHAALGLLLALLAALLRRQPGSRGGWAALATTAVIFLGSGAWLVHAVSRLDHVVPLMTVTLLHQLGAAVWIGGTGHLVLLWRFLRCSSARQETWPLALERFSPLAMGAVAAIAGSGLYLSWNYIAGLRGLFGTAYGSMVLTKTGLMGFALCLGGLNFLSIRSRRIRGEADAVFGRVPPFVETETGAGLIILLAAAALTSQPPAVDILSDSALPAEVLAVFAPKAPQLVPPPYRDLLAQAASSFDPFAISGKLDRLQSNFNHNISGIFVILIALGALLDRSGRVRWARHWPLLFLLLAGFILIIAEPNGWPFGSEGFWETLIVPGVLEHRLAAFLVAGLAFFEWRVRVGGLAGSRWQYVFPSLCFAGGALMLTHSHSVFAIKWAFLIEVSHNAIGLLAVLIGAGRWLELRLPPPSNRFPAILWPVCLMLVGLVLLFYRET
jgi:putative copper resistance protein D